MYSNVLEVVWNVSFAIQLRQSPILVVIVTILKHQHKTSNIQPPSVTEIRLLFKSLLAQCVFKLLGCKRGNFLSYYPSAIYALTSHKSPMQLQPGLVKKISLITGISLIARICFSSRKKSLVAKKVECSKQQSEGGTIFCDQAPRKIPSKHEATQTVVLLSLDTVGYKLWTYVILVFNQCLALVLLTIKCIIFITLSRSVAVYFCLI